MIKITNQKELRLARNLKFCYLCGKLFTAGIKVEINCDHVPPNSLFLKVDRNPPLKLKTHVKCNNHESGEDEIIGQLVSLLHLPIKRINKLDIRSVKVKNKKIYGIKHDLKSIVWRWVRGFHAALYKEFLPKESLRGISLPWQSGKITEYGVKVDKLLIQHPIFINEIKKNREISRIDLIKCRNDKLVYECTWAKSDQNQDFCIFALKIYNWENLGSPELTLRGCVGFYIPTNGRPELGTQGTRLEIFFKNNNILDAFKI